MKKPWFIRSGRFYKPIAAMGWIVSISLLSVLVYLITNRLLKHDILSKTLTDISLYTIIAASTFVLIAYTTQKR